MEPSDHRANLGSSVYTRIGAAKFQQSRNYGVVDSSTAGKNPPPGEKLVVSFRSFLESVAQAAPGPTPVLVSVLRRAPMEGATVGIR
jgi:hypothetical protein